MVEVRFDVQGTPWSFNERWEYSWEFSPESEPELNVTLRITINVFSRFKCSASMFIEV